MIRNGLLRLLLSVPTLLVLVAISFLLAHSAPGGPLDREQTLDAEAEARQRAALHLDQPLTAQFGRYLGGLLRGDLGASLLHDGRSVAGLIADGAPVSAAVGGLALLIAVVGGIAAGVIGARRPGRLPDRCLSLLTLIGLSVPAYVTAPLSVLVFAVWFDALPAGGLDDGLASLLLPSLALAAPQLAAIARLTRATLIDVLDAPWIRTARALGLPERQIVLRHALGPALVPVVATLGPLAAGLLTGSIVVEQVFSLPGIGRHFVQGALNRDYPLVLGVVLLYGALVVVLTALSDLAAAALDPRLRR